VVIDLRDRKKDWVKIVRPMESRMGVIAVMDGIFIIVIWRDC
jgi:hypothetical protein